MSFDLQQALAQLQSAYDASSEQVSTQLAKLKVSRTPVRARDVPN